MSVYDAAAAGEYDNTVPYPKRVEKPAILLKRFGELFGDDLSEAIRAMGQYETDLATQGEARIAYNLEERRLHLKLQSDLEVEHGLSGHPRAALLYQLAYDRGHSAGMSEVALYYSEMAELIVGTKVVA
jgi:hypothetical protein